MAATVTRVDVTNDNKGDLVLNLYKPIKNTNSKETFDGVDGKKIHGKIVRIMTVSRQVLTGNSRSFKAEFMSDHWAESIAKIVDMEVDDEDAVEVVLRVLHKTMTSNIYEVSIKVVWEVIQYCKYREIDVAKLNDWFAKWVDRKNFKKLVDLREMSQLLTPCYVFDHAKGFASLTRKLVHNTDRYILEINPSAYDGLNLDGNIISALNAARGSLRTQLYQPLHQTMVRFQDLNCHCKERYLFAYHGALMNCGVESLYGANRVSIRELLDNPNLTGWGPQIPHRACWECVKLLGSKKIKNIIESSEKYLQGLCLNCMKSSKDVDQEHWDQRDTGNFSEDCRIQHTQSTYSFSFMGRKTDVPRRGRRN